MVAAPNGGHDVWAINALASELKQPTRQDPGTTVHAEEGEENT